MQRVAIRRLIPVAGVLILTVAVAAGVAFTRGAGASQLTPRVQGNAIVDQDTGAQFSSNKQNEPAITRDPLTGALVAGANDEIQQPPCRGTTTPLASPCPFAPGVPTSGYYRSTD